MTSKLESAVFTLVHNEKVFLPIWVNYYSKFFKQKDIYIINHDSDDGSIENIKNEYPSINIITIHHSKIYDDDFMVDNIIYTQHRLLEKYKIVVYSDADELLITDPNMYKNLIDFLKSFNNDFVRCTSRSIIHQQNEPRFDPTKKVLSQRSVWFEELQYDKTLISKVPLVWSRGLHEACTINGKQIKPKVDRGLILLHLARIDYDMRVIRNKYVATKQWGNAGDEGMQRNIQGKELFNWFYYFPQIIAHESGLPFFIENIPDKYKNIV